MFPHVSKSGQTLRNISKKNRETSNVSEFARKHFCFSRSKFCFRNNVSTGGQTGKHLRKHRESHMFPQQCFLVCSGLKFRNLNEVLRIYDVDADLEFLFCSTEFSSANDRESLLCEVDL
jgi:hypothetical protein